MNANFTGNTKEKQTFSLVSNIDVEKTVFNVKLNLFMNNFYKQTHFQKQPFANVLKNKCPEQFRNTQN